MTTHQEAKLSLAMDIYARIASVQTFPQNYAGGGESTGDAKAAIELADKFMKVWRELHPSPDKGPTMRQL